MTGEILFRLNRIRKTQERELRLINRKALQGKLGYHPHAEGPPFFLDWSFEHQFNSTSRTLSETIGKWVLLKWGVRTLWGAVIRDKTTKSKIRIPMWSSVAQLQEQKMGPYLESRKNLLIRPHVYTHLVTRQHSSTFVYMRLWLVYIRLHSSTLV